MMTTITPTRARELWVKALRSGDYKQTEGQLRFDPSGRTPISSAHLSYCCLGVACNLYAEHVGGEWEQEAFNPPGRFKKAGGLLPPVVMRWLGLTTEDGKVQVLAKRRCHRSTTLAELNDDGLTFDQIADLIEAGLVITKEEKSNG